MVALFLETSTERSLVFFYDQQVVFQKEFPVGLNNSKYIFPALQEGMKTLGVAVGDLSFIGVGIGPGSYTGMRVGAAVAQGLSYGSCVPLVGVPTLACFAPDADGPFVVLIDAKIRGVYLMTGLLEKGSIRHTSESQVLPLEGIGDVLHDMAWIVTPNDTVLRPKLLSLYPQLSCQWKVSAPSPRHMAAWALERQLLEAHAQVSSLDLIYL